MEQNIACQAARQNLVGAAALQDRLHHDEGVADLRSAQHEHTGLLGILHQLGDHAVLLLKQSAHRGRKYLLKSAECRLVSV